jgi:hypothetical protein
MRLSIEVHIDGRCDGGGLMSATGVSREPTLLTIGEATISSRASWNGVLAYVRPAMEPKRLSRGVGDGPRPNHLGGGTGTRVTW